MPIDQTIKLGEINFINCLPVNYALQQNLDQAPFVFELVSGVPSFLNTKLRAGEIDLAPISSYEYLLHQESYCALSNISISSKSSADSVLFFIKDSSFFQTNPSRIYVTDKSASSVNLLKIILVKRFGFDLEQCDFVCFSGSGQGLPNKLLIGDEALLHASAPYDQVIDLGLAWQELTGLPMVFALWVLNKGSKFLEHKLMLQDFFAELRDQGLEKLYPDVIVQAFKQTGISKTRLDQYFNNLDYAFTVEHQRSLELYRNFLVELGLLSTQVTKNG